MPGAPGAAKRIQSVASLLSSVRVDCSPKGFELHAPMAPEKRRRGGQDDEKIEIFEVERATSSLQQASVGLTLKTLMSKLILNRGKKLEYPMMNCALKVPIAHQMGSMNEKQRPSMRHNSGANRAL